MSDNNLSTNIEELLQYMFHLGYKAKEKEDAADVPVCMSNKHKTIIQAVCDYFDTSIEILKRRTRKERVRFPRQVCMYFLSKYTDLKLVEIGDIFGRYDHTTVLHARNTIKDLLYVADDKVLHAVSNIEMRIQQAGIQERHPYKATFNNQ